MPNEQVSDALPSFRLDGRLAVVTGSSEGIGRAIAEAYAVVGRRSRSGEPPPRATCRAFSAPLNLGGKAHVIPADLSKLEDIRALESGVLKLIAGREPSLVLVNCAGFGFTKAALETTEEDWDRLLDLHAKGTFFCSQPSREK